MEEVLAAPRSASNTYALELASWEVEQQHMILQAYDTPWLLPKHKIFISHSGRQKDFAEQLCEDLETHGYYPFFDRRSDSLPKGEKFPPLIFKAARECLLAIVLISNDFFTKTKWPMLELAAFVQAQKTRKDLCILPVLLGLTIEGLGNTEKWSKFWIKWGMKDQRLTHDVIIEWKEAVKALRPINMILKSSYDGEVKLRKGIVECIHKMMPPDIRSDILHVQGRERLCKKVRSMFDEIPSTSRLCENATVLGVYGIGGAGKSALCMIMTEYLRSEFLGRVCFVELGKETSTVDLQRKVLRQLCRDNEDYLDKHVSTEKEGLNRLRERICRERVFLALDNVSDHATSINIAKSFLTLKFHPNSMVLVTSRGDEVLCGSLGIREESCMRCPSITKDEALQILLEQVNLPLELLDTEHTQVLHHAVELSFFEGTYHPLALQLFAAQLGADPSKWTEIKLDLQWTSDLEHPLFSKIETNYMRLPDQHTKDIFMDIALFTPKCVCGIDDIIWWLTDTINHAHEDLIKQKVRTLRVKSLLEIWKMEVETYRIHDLYCILAERIASVGNVVPKYIYQRGGIVAPEVLLDNNRAKIVERAAFVEAKFDTLGLEACTQLKVLSARRCEKMRTLCIQRLGYLVSLELVVCPLESLDLSGLSNLRWLHVLSCKDLMKLDASELERLRHVNVSKCSKLEDLNFKNCPMVNSVSILYSDRLRHVNLGSGQSLKCLTLWFCGSLTDVEISSVAHLTTLKKRGCPHLLAMQGGDIMCKDLQYMSLEKWGKLSSTFVSALEISASLQVLDIWHSCLSRLPDLRTCLNLQELRLRDVDVLLESNNEKLLQEYEKVMHISTEAVKLPKSLEDIRIESCKNMVVKEIFWKVQGLTNLRLLSLCDVRVGWDWELYRTDLGGACILELEEGSAGSRGVIEDLSCKEDEAVCDESAEVSTLKNEIDVMHGKLSMGLGAKFSGEMHDEISVSGHLNEIMHWIEVFLDSKTNLYQMEHLIKAELQHWKTGAEYPTLQQDLGWMFWSSMAKAVEIRGSPCWVIEQIIHKTFNNCDSLCECLQQVLSKDCPQGEEIRHIMEFCQKVHVKEICGQLLFLTAKQFTDIVQHYDVLEMWERIIIEEVLARRTSIRKIENETVIIPRLGTLVKRLELLCVCRGWQVESGVELKRQELMQFAWDWLWACRVCLSLEQLKGCLAKQSEVTCQMELHLHEMQELLQRFDVMFRVEVEKLMEDALVSDKGCSFKSLDTVDNHDRLGGLIRCWKVRQWLQEVVSGLSVHLMQEVESDLSVHFMREEKPRENLEVCHLINEITRQVHTLEVSSVLKSMENMEGKKRFAGNCAALKREAEWLVTKMREEWPDTESLCMFLGVESNIKKRIVMKVNALCEKTEIFFEHIKTGLIPFLEWTAVEVKLKAVHRNLLDSMDTLDMQQWQCRKFLADSVEIGGKRSRWLQLPGAKSFWADRVVALSLEWAETLARKLTAEIEFMDLVLHGYHPSNMAYGESAVHMGNTRCVRERAVRLASLLIDEVQFLSNCHRDFLLFHSVRQLAPLSLLFVGFGDFMTSYEHLLESPLLEILQDPRKDLRIFYERFRIFYEHFCIFHEPFSSADSRRTMSNVGKLSTVIVGGGQVKLINRNLEMEISESSKHFLQEELEMGMEDPSDWKLEMGMEDPSDWKLEMERLRRAIRAPSLTFRRMWDDVNSKQRLGLPFSQCTQLRSLYVSNCWLTHPIHELSGQWTMREFDFFPLEVMHFRRLDCPSARLAN